MRKCYNSFARYSILGGAEFRVLLLRTCALGGEVLFNNYVMIYRSVNWRILSQQICSLASSFQNVSRHLFPKKCFNINTYQCLYTLKLKSPQFEAVLTPEVKKLINIFNNYGYELRIVGGAVRDILIHEYPTDIDFATTATPAQMKEIFSIENVRIINARGEAHGTLLIRVDDKQNFEVTTLRIDARTDGRHADVIYTTDWQLDASRRDLTINSMSLGLDGTLYDYFNGTEDLKKRKVIFVGDPAQRIKEDYLRILRYFRFYGRVSLHPNSHDVETIKAIRENVDGLKVLSGERIWVELRKILTGNHCTEIIKKMIELDMAPHIGLPNYPNINEFKKVCVGCLDLQPHPMTLLTALLYDNKDLETLRSRLKVPNYEYSLSDFILTQRSEEIYKEELEPYQELVVKTTIKPKHIHEWICELFKYKGNKRLLDLFREWDAPRFPITFAMLMKQGLKSGPKITIIIHHLKQMWISSNYTMTSEELLSHLPSVISIVSKQSKCNLRK